MLIESYANAISFISFFYIFIHHFYFLRYIRVLLSSKPYNGCPSYSKPTPLQYLDNLNMLSLHLWPQWAAAHIGPFAPGTLLRSYYSWNLPGIVCLRIGCIHMSWEYVLPWILQPIPLRSHTSQSFALHLILCMPGELLSQKSA